MVWDFMGHTSLVNEGWRLVTNEESLLGRILEAKNYPKGDFLSSILIYSLNFSWGKVWAVKNLLIEGLGW